jgi:YD repeat-containing protein
MTRYVYDADGNITSKTDANGTVSTFIYDALSRVIQKSHSDTAPNTPTVNLCYDGKVTATSSTGTVLSCSGAQGLVKCKCVWAVTYIGNANSRTIFTSFDGLGRPLNHSQQTLTASGWTQPYPFIYTYNAHGLIGEQYPSTRVVNTSYDGAGRVSLVSSGVTNYATLTTTPASSFFAYAPHGAIRQINLGNGLFETTTYNSCLQTTAIRLGSTAGSSSVAAFFPYYCPSSGTGCATNNGNVLSADVFPLGARDTHTYDAAGTLDRSNGRYFLLLSRSFASSRRCCSAGKALDARFFTSATEPYCASC